MAKFRQNGRGRAAGVSHLGQQEAGQWVVVGSEAGVSLGGRGANLRTDDRNGRGPLEIVGAGGQRVFQALHAGVAE